MPAVDAASNYKGAIYMVFDYAEHDLTGMIDSYKGKLTIAQVGGGFVLCVGACLLLDACPEQCMHGSV